MESFTDGEFPIKSENAVVDTVADTYITVRLK
jgi:hypothetical protein